MNCRPVFESSALCLLSLTAAAKLVSATSKAAVMHLPDPLLGLSHRQILIAAALIELGIVSAWFCRMAPWRKHLLLLWLSSSMLIYRVALHFIAPGRPCPCLGSLTEKLPFSPATVNIALGSMVVYWIAGSFLFVARLYPKDPRVVTTAASMGQIGSGASLE